MNKTTDLTLEILPAKDLLQQTTDAWNTSGNALNGYVGLVVAIFSVGGSGIGAYLFKNRQGRGPPPGGGATPGGGAPIHW